MPVCGCSSQESLAQIVAAGSEPDNTREGVMVMDMGLHAIPTLVEPQQIIQVLIPGVEERARHLPPLMSSSRLMPGESLAHSCHNMAPPPPGSSSHLMSQRGGGLLRLGI